MLASDHPFNPGEHKYSMILPIGGMIILGLTCLILGFVFWPDPKPHLDSTTEGTFPPAAASQGPAAAGQPTAPRLPPAADVSPR